MRASEVFTLLGLIGGLGGVATLITAWPTVRKMRAEETRAAAEAKHLHVDSDVSIRQAGLAELRAIVEAQRAHMENLERDLARVREEVAELRADAARFWRAVDYARQLLAWARSAEPRPTVPEVPADLADYL